MAFQKAGRAVFPKANSTRMEAANMLGKRGGASAKGKNTLAKLKREEALALREAGALLGRLGGLASAGKTSKEKKEASRDNGKKGGRPTFASQGLLTAYEKKLKRNRDVVAVTAQKATARKKKKE